MLFKLLKHTSFGFRLIFFYVIVTHIIPGFLYETHVFSYIDDTLIYKRTQGSLSLFLFLLFYLCALLFLDVGLKKYTNKKFFSNRLGLIKKCMPFLLMLSFLLSLIFYFILPHNFRYLDVGLSESDSFFPLLVFTIIPSFNKFFLFYYIFCGRFPFSEKYNFLRYFIVISLFLSANGTNTFIVFLLGALFLLIPKYFRKAIFVVKTNFFTFLIKPLLIVAIVVTIVYPLAIIFGQSIKGGQSFSEVYEKMNVKESEDIGNIQYEYGLIRFNQYYISTKTGFYHFFGTIELDTRIEYCTSIFNNFVYRVSRILNIPLKVEKPKYSSVSQINFANIAPYSSDREGTSTGLFGGFLYLFPTPINTIILLIYSSFLIIIINNIYKCLPNRLSLLGMAVFLYWLFTLFEGPMDFLLIVDDTFLILLLYNLYFL